MLIVTYFQMCVPLFETISLLGNNYPMNTSDICLKKDYCRSSFFFFFFVYRFLCVCVCVLSISPSSSSPFCFSCPPGYFPDLSPPIVPSCHDTRVKVPPLVCNCTTSRRRNTRGSCRLQSILSNPDPGSDRPGGSAGVDSRLLRCPSSPSSDPDFPVRHIGLPIRPAWMVQFLAASLGALVEKSLSPL